MYIISAYKAGNEHMQATILHTTKLIIDLKNWFIFPRDFVSIPYPSCGMHLVT
jgi:hypothetical protein